MGTTSLGIPYPENTDLVKDGAADMQALAEAANDLYGLVHINTTSFSAVASQSINDVFSADYDNYKIIVSGINSTATDIEFRLRVGGSDNSTANSYVRQDFTATGTTVVGSRTTTNLWRVGTFDTSLQNTFIMEIFDPFKAAATGYQSYNLYATSGAVINIRYGTHNQNTSYSGFTIFPTTGTTTGQLSVFAYKK